MSGPLIKEHRMFHITLVYYDAEMNKLVQANNLGRDQRKWGVNEVDLRSRDWSPRRLVDDYLDTVDHRKVVYADVIVEELLVNSNIAISTSYSLYQVKKNGLGTGHFCTKV